MTLAPLIAAPLAIQVHVIATLTALGAGVIVLVAPKGTRFHLALGHIFAATMLVAAISSFWITSLSPGRYSPIHILSVVTLITIPLAILARRRGDIRAHSIAMCLNFAGLIIAGAFAVLSSNRLVHQLIATFAMSLFP